MADQKKEKDYDTFDHWSTEPVKVKHAYQPESYSELEWKAKKKVERKGDPLWEHAPYESDLEELEIG